MYYTIAKDDHHGEYISATMMKIMIRIKTSGRFIMMGMVVPFLVPLQIRSSLMMTDRILCPWEGRDMLKSKINLGSSFYFQMKILMQ